MSPAPATLTRMSDSSVHEPTTRTFPLNHDWYFAGPIPPHHTNDTDALEQLEWVPVTLPHTVIPLSWRDWDPASWEQEWCYRLHFDVPANRHDHRWFLDFGAALAGVRVTLNNRELGGHLGGYLPFGFEVTDVLRERGNALTVLLDSRFCLNVPPNRPGPPAQTTSVDFWQPGGLYRPVTLRAVPGMFIADVFATPRQVLNRDRHIDVRCTVDAGRSPDGPAWVHVALRGGDRVLAETSQPVRLDSSGREEVRLVLEDLDDVELWSPAHPQLYDVISTLFIDGYPVHEHRTRVGLREVRWTTEGFFLNGERLRLVGLNRHQFFPFAGAAMPERVQRRDAEILRSELNCNIVRCSHYPQSEAFLDACDELGLLVFEEGAGWGRYIGDAQWREYVRRDVRQMVLRDRNRPSVVVWGARLNENDDDVALWAETRDLAHSLDGSRPTTGAMIAEMYASPHFVQDVFSFNDYAGEGEVPQLRPPRRDRPYLISEAVGTLSGPAELYRRIDPVAAQQGQAVAHAQVHEQAAADDRYCGLIAWCGYDYPSGTGNQWHGIKTPGVIDLFREPKLGAAIYRSQVDPRIRPVIEPAFYWDFGPGSPPDGPGTAMICANCDRLELSVGGSRFATVYPDRHHFGHLPYPPSFVDLTVHGDELPELRIDGYLDHELALSRSFSADPSGDVLAVRADDAELVADGIDTTRVVFRAFDRYGAARPYVGGEVTITVDGTAVLIGESPFAFGDAGAVGAVWIRSLSGAAGVARVTATHPELGSHAATITMRPPPEPR